VDYRAGRSVYYLPDDTTVDLSFERPHAPIGTAFDADGVRSAIRGASKAA
jgi:hypothetical protein